MTLSFISALPFAPGAVVSAEIGTTGYWFQPIPHCREAAPAARLVPVPLSRRLLFPVIVLSRMVAAPFAVPPNPRAVAYGIAIARDGVVSVDIIVFGTEG